MAPRPPATLIVSPLASRLRAAKAREDLVLRATAAIRARGHAELTVVETGDPTEIAAAARAAVDGGVALVVLAGGDGTIRDAADALADSSVEVGLLPCGTGNLYATAVGVPRALDGALRVLETGQARSFDLGEVGLIAPPGSSEATTPVARVTFGVACGTGFDAQVIAATDRELKRRYGVAAYFLAASRLLPRLEPRSTTIVIDGVRTELESVVVLVANCGEAIPGMLRPRLPIAPDDGVLHVFVLRRGGILGGVRGAVQLMTAESRGMSTSGHAVRLVGRQVRVEVEPAGPTQVDGDAFPTAWLDARVRPGALRVVSARRA
ncbi:MAG TPA: diacylglycerol kinase family protein [Candidatus Limnocylindrales bacterium]